MRIRNVVIAGVVALSGSAAVVALGGPVGAQAVEPCPAGQPPGRTPGNPTSGPATGRPVQYPPGKCELRLSRSVVAPGGNFQAAGSGFAPGSPVEVTLSGASLATATTDGDGAFNATMVVPESTRPGSHTVSASGPAAGGGTQVLSAALQVTAAGGAGGSDRGRAGASSARAGGDLPRTGSPSTLPLAVAGGALVAAGLGTVVVGRRWGTRRA